MIIQGNLIISKFNRRIRISLESLNKLLFFSLILIPSRGKYFPGFLIYYYLALKKKYWYQIHVFHFSTQYQFKSFDHTTFRLDFYRIISISEILKKVTIIYIDIDIFSLIFPRTLLNSFNLQARNVFWLFPIVFFTIVSIPLCSEVSIGSINYI